MIEKTAGILSGLVWSGHHWVSSLLSQLPNYLAILLTSTSDLLSALCSSVTRHLSACVLHLDNGTQRFLVEMTSVGNLLNTGLRSLLTIFWSLFLMWVSSTTTTTTTSSTTKTTLMTPITIFTIFCPPQPHL